MSWFKSKEEKENEILEKAEKIKKEKQTLEEIRDEIHKGKIKKFAEHLEPLSTERLLEMKERARYEVAMWFVDKEELQSYKSTSLNFDFGDYNVVKGSTMDSLCKFFEWRDEKRAVAANFLIEVINFILKKRGLDINGKPKNSETPSS